MTKFKIGDRVQANGTAAFSFRDKIITVSEVVRYCGEDCFLTEDSVHTDYQYPMSSFVLISSMSPIEEAKKLLEAEGYSLITPKPKMTGKAYIYRSLENPNDVDIFDSKRKRHSEPVIAIVDWTEGDGI